LHFDRFRYFIIIYKFIFNQKLYIDEWMSEYLIKSKDFMNTFEKPLIEENYYGYENGELYLKF